ncbi:MAG: phosphoglucomutase/phosphomannomutase family protein [Saprospiraceae bacterium]|nr:phosphoglucomutase/phosphomannomutase family protein [Saprospiraceae bacterium]MBP7679997.1 phosphoglucomutase/phosphomannomutase family protein [Saprospiraceae bacterium]
MAVTIKFGTDGWRAIIAQEYTVDNLKRVAAATAQWLKNNGQKSVVIGHDCRFAGQLFAETTATIMGAHGIKSYLAKGYVSTPMVSLGVVKKHADLGVVITASHNPPSYNGFKLKSSYGGPTIPADITAVENLIPEAYNAPLPSLDTMLQNGLLEYIDLEEMYLRHVKENFDLPLIRTAGIKLAYDAMYGAGQRVIMRLFPDAVLLHCENNPGFDGQAPEPIHRNLTELSETIRKNPAINLGLANDGDADRIGLYDEDGEFVDSHCILLLLLLYLYKYKGMNGDVVVTFSVTDKMRKMANIFGLPCEVTKIGFKYIAEIMTKRDVLVGGEESGGLAVKGHIPERDGIWIGLVIMEFMAKTGKSLKELIQEVYDIVGTFSFDRDDLHISEVQKQNVINNCKNNTYTAFGEYRIQSVEDIDGYKFNLAEDTWVMIRPSGTEPVLRVYAQAPTAKEARAILDATKATIL